MATKRMYSTKVTDSDAFIEMSSSAQALYFHLNQGADDDGFNNQIQIAMMKSHSSTDDLKVLLAKKFILRFDNGVIVIKHWRIHNTLRKDRFSPTNFQEELKHLGIKENGAYTLLTTDKIEKEARRLPIGCQLVAVVENSIVENSKEKSERVFTPPSLEEIKKYCKDNSIKINPECFFSYYNANGWMLGKVKMQDWKSAIDLWQSREPKSKKSQKKIFEEEQEQLKDKYIKISTQAEAIDFLSVRLLAVFGKADEEKFFERDWVIDLLRKYNISKYEVYDKIQGEN